MTAATPDARAFRDALGLFPTGVAVIATEVDGHVHAMTANAVSSLSLEPMLVLFCPAKKARFAALLDAAERFSISFLRDDQEALSTYFAGGGREPEPPPFRFVRAGGTPRLEGALAALVGAKHRIHDSGYHWLVVVEVHHIHRGVEPHRPLVFYRGKYARVDRLTGAKGPDLLASADEPAQMFYHD